MRYIKQSMLALVASLSVFHLAYADEALLAQPNARAFVDKMVAQGYSKNQMELILREVVVKPKIIEAMDKPGTSRPYYQFQAAYFPRGIKNSELLNKGLAFWAQHEADLAYAAKLYDVNPAVIVAIIGVETRYGEYTGNYRVADALATLAFQYPRRAAFFEQELMALIQMAQEEKRDIFSFKGSYAGAMGWPQFMPSSFLKFAVDADKDGQRNIWNNRADIIMSVAHYFTKHGWSNQEATILPINEAWMPELKQLPFGLKNPQPLSFFINKGFPATPPPAAIFVDQSVKPWLNQIGANDPVYLLRLETAPNVFSYRLGLGNFDTLLKYNQSTHYASLVHEFSQFLYQAK